jgi:RimJ/RimL family protein N-acetyltransferase
MKIPANELETPRLKLRRWRVQDAALLADAIATSVPELTRWTPWVVPDAPAVTVLEERLSRFSRQFDAGEHFIYGVFDRSEMKVLGQSGLYGRVGPDALEIGYFTVTAAAGQGYATEAAAALTRVAFEQCGVDRVEIRCDPENAASAVIPKRLGYRLREVAERDPLFPDDVSRRLMIWQLFPADYTQLAQLPPYTGIVAGPLR